MGKTAIVEGLAQRIVNGDAPDRCCDKRVLQLDVGSLVAGTMYRGQFEERLKRVIEEIKTATASCSSTKCTCWSARARPERRSMRPTS